MKSLVLCSGGIKSAFLTAAAVKEGDVTLLFIDHGQPNVMWERASVLYLTNRHRVKFSETKMKGFPSLQEPLLRFLCFFSCAAPIARSLQISKLYHGFSRDDMPIITDAKLVEEFIMGLQHLLNISTANYDDAGLWLGRIDLDTPLRRLNLEHILRLGNEWKLNWTQLRTCETAKKLACGVCASCKRRRIAFVREGSRKDPIIYGE